MCSSTTECRPRYILPPVLRSAVSGLRVWAHTRCFVVCWAPNGGLCIYAITSVLRRNCTRAEYSQRPLTQLLPGAWRLAGGPCCRLSPSVKVYRPLLCYSPKTQPNNPQTPKGAVTAERARMCSG